MAGSRVGTLSLRSQGPRLLAPFWAPPLPRSSSLGPSPGDPSLTTFQRQSWGGGWCPRAPTFHLQVSQVTLELGRKNGGTLEKPPGFELRGSLLEERGERLDRVFPSRAGPVSIRVLTAP